MLMAAGVTAPWGAGCTPTPGGSSPANAVTTAGAESTATAVPAAGAPVKTDGASANVRRFPVLQVQSKADLERVGAEYLKRLGDATEGTFEVRFAPGDYRGAGWSLLPPRGADDAARTTHLDVVLRGAAGVVVDAPAGVRARHLVIEDLSLAVANQQVRLEAETALELNRVQVVDGRGASMDGHGTLLSLLARGHTGVGMARPVTATLRDCWFVRNFADPRGMSLLAFDVSPHTKAYWKQIDIEGAVFLGNVLANDLSLTAALETRIRDTLWFRDRADGMLVRSQGSGAVLIERSLLVVADRDQVAAHDAESPPITLGAGTRVVVSPTASGDGLPKGTLGAGGAVLTDAALSADAAALVGRFKDPVEAATLRPRVQALLQR